ncbi:MAG: hypothetical protein GVY27_06720 [Deinococcus-Thermus bacterium]|jgi:hypothetical protein|nr:hypothetical protein [Deinococcota bacterium]
MLKKLALLLPLILPTVLYLIYALATHQQRVASGGQAPAQWWEEAPWLWLALSGVGLLAIVLGTWALFFDGASPDTIYIPPRFEDGEIVPGRMVPADEG